MLASFFLFAFHYQLAEVDTFTHSMQSILRMNNNAINTPTHPLMLVIPHPKQGFFCNFEDQIQRKKVPIDFGLKLK